MIISRLQTKSLLMSELDVPAGRMDKVVCHIIPRELSGTFFTEGTAHQQGNRSTKRMSDRGPARTRDGVESN